MLLQVSSTTSSHPSFFVCESKEVVSSADRSFTSSRSQRNFSSFTQLPIVKISPKKLFFLHAVHDMTEPHFYWDLHHRGATRDSHNNMESVLALMHLENGEAYGKAKLFSIHRKGWLCQW